MPRKLAHIGGVDPDEVRLIVLKDGTVMELDKYNRAVKASKYSDRVPDSSEIKDLILRSENENKPGGANFEVTKKILENFRLYNLSYTSGKVVKQELKNKIDASLDFAHGPVRMIAYDEGDADEWTSMFLKRKPERVVEFAKKEENLSLANYLVEIVTDILEQLEASDIESYNLAYQLIYDRYVNPEHAGYDFTYFERLADLTHATYARKINESISLMSKLIFGVLPDENNLFDYAKENSKK